MALFSVHMGWWDFTSQRTSRNGSRAQRRRQQVVYTRDELSKLIEWVTSKDISLVWVVLMWEFCLFGRIFPWSTSMLVRMVPESEGSTAVTLKISDENGCEICESSTRRFAQKENVMKIVQLRSLKIWNLSSTRAPNFGEYSSQNCSSIHVFNFNSSTRHEIPVSSWSPAEWKNQQEQRSLAPSKWEQGLNYLFLSSLFSCTRNRV